MTPDQKGGGANVCVKTRFLTLYVDKTQGEKPCTSSAETYIRISARST